MSNQERAAESVDGALARGEVMDHGDVYGLCEHEGTRIYDKDGDMWELRWVCDAYPQHKFDNAPEPFTTEEQE